MIIDFISLTALQIVLSIDNVIFISVLTQKLDPKIKKKARFIGLILSLVMNTVLISFASYLTDFNSKDILLISGHHFTLHQMILFLGGMFLIWKTSKEVHEKFDRKKDEKQTIATSFKQTIISMFFIDMIFSIDSTITAVGMTDIRWMQVGSVLLAVTFMYFFFNKINQITEKYPSLKMIALCFLFLIGFNLLTESLGFDIPKGYTYSAMVVTLLAEFLNIKYENYLSKK